MRFMKKEDKEKVEMFNKVAHMKHRTKPYDINNPDDLIEAVNMATGEYMDIFHYSCTLDNINEEFDESIEYYYPDTWLNTTMDGECDSDIMKAFSSLQVTIDAFKILEDRAEEKCHKLWSIVLSSTSEKVKQHFFEGNIVLDSEKVEAVIDTAFENISNEIYAYCIEVTTMNFAKHVKGIIEAHNKEV